MANIKKWNICTRKTYQKNGEEKAFWPQVGQMTYFPAYQDRKAGFKLELNMFPGTEFFVFEQVEREAPKQKETYESQEPEGEIDINSIPF